MEKTTHRAAQYVRRVADMMSVTLVTILGAYSMCVVALRMLVTCVIRENRGYDFILVHPLIIVRYNDMV